MKQDVEELRNLPLESLITAPLNAAIAAQANAALSTVAFVEQVGFVSQNPRRSIFDQQTASDVSDVRVAELRVNRQRADASGTVVTDQVTISLPYVSLFNIPAIEISSLDWQFNVKLNSIQQFEVDFTHSVTTTTTTGGDVGGSLEALGIPVKIGGNAKVQLSSKTDFALRYGAGREQEYDLAITIRANQAPQPKGILRLLDLAETIAAGNQEAALTPPPAPPGPEE